MRGVILGMAGLGVWVRWKRAGSEAPSGMLADVDHGVEEFSAQQGQGGAPIEENVMEGIGEDLAHPNDAGDDVLYEEELEHTEGDASDADAEPDLAQAMEVAGKIGYRRKGPEERGGEKQEDWSQRPEAHEDDLTAEVVAHLDVFLMLVGDLIDPVEVMRFEEEVTSLACGHGDTPCHEGGGGGIDEEQGVGDQEAEGTHQVKALVDSGLVIEPMVIPTLDA